ncbi:MAG: hypothetical protein PHU74_01435 [Candidatus Pacebacteria bacterium]|nr:hypothetical protein [Candidatus Paceibacterota bacterium]
MELVNSLIELPLSLDPLATIVLSFLLSLVLAFALYKFATGQHVCCIAFYSIVGLFFIPGILGALLGAFASILSTIALIAAALWAFYEAKLEKKRVLVAEIKKVEPSEKPLED